MSERIQESGRDVGPPSNGLCEPGGVYEGDAAEVERLEAELASEREGHLRALADFDNYRRRARLEIAGAERAGRRDLLLGLLDVMDDFDRAVRHVADAPGAVADGLGLIHQRLRRLLESNGVTRCESLGEWFDPLLHEAIGVVEREGATSGVVCEEERPGYRWDGELLRPARVIVAK
jgi:molecular chaperone GrpE